MNYVDLLRDVADELGDHTYTGRAGHVAMLRGLADALESETLQRHWVLARCARYSDDRRTCAHAPGFEGEDAPIMVDETRGYMLPFTCVQCAEQWGRQIGHLEAGAWYTTEEVFHDEQTVDVRNQGPAHPTPGPADRAPDEG